MRQLQTALKQEEYLDGPTVARLKRDMVQAFKAQIEFGVRTAAAEAALRTLTRQLRAGKVVVKLFLAFPLHAKLYLVHRQDYHTPLISYLGGSDLTFAGLSRQGELNVDFGDRQHVGICDGYPPSAVFGQTLYTTFARIGPRIAGSEELVATFRDKAEQTGLFVPAGGELKCMLLSPLSKEQIQQLVDLFLDLARQMKEHGLRQEEEVE